MKSRIARRQRGSIGYALQEAGFMVLTASRPGYRRTDLAEALSALKNEPRASAYGYDRWTAALLADGGSHVCFGPS